MLFLICFFFFFQAEDGIRDLVRSRGLGDVYKRQIAVRLGPLGGWVRNQRKARKKNKLSKDQIEKAEAAGLKWDNRDQLGGRGVLPKQKDRMRWEKKFAELKRFRETAGGSAWPSRHNHMQLYYWCRHQRMAARNEVGLAAGRKSVTYGHRISEQNMQRLKAMGFDFSSGPGS
eukprot:TRINITY_DN6732_c0_g1_i8.p1 TRINITY_DN6732_c0_g1~~TRINITY_DN6732_c0_g1_i8.p1  ORF type:complete len:173 (+),score=33.86 TRINITY_DN6732_c0_g1_i8:9-527(+)